MTPSSERSEQSSKIITHGSVEAIFDIFNPRQGTPVEIFGQDMAVSWAIENSLKTGEGSTLSLAMGYEIYDSKTPMELLQGLAANARVNNLASIYTSLLTTDLPTEVYPYNETEFQKQLKLLRRKPQNFPRYKILVDILVRLMAILDSHLMVKVPGLDRDYEYLRQVFKFPFAVRRKGFTYSYTVDMGWMMEVCEYQTKEIDQVLSSDLKIIMEAHPSEYVPSLPSLLLGEKEILKPRINVDLNY